MGAAAKERQAGGELHDIHDAVLVSVVHVEEALQLNASTCKPEAGTAEHSRQVGEDSSLRRVCESVCVLGTASYVLNAALVRQEVLGKDIQEDGKRDTPISITSSIKGNHDISW